MYLFNVRKVTLLQTFSCLSKYLENLPPHIGYIPKFLVDVYINTEVPGLAIQLGYVLLFI